MNIELHNSALTIQADQVTHTEATEEGLEVYLEDSLFSVVIVDEIDAQALLSELEEKDSLSP